MKKLSSIILTVLLVVSIIPTGLFSITASALTSDYYTYTVSNGEATITDCSTSISGDITVPSTMGGYPVTSIGMFAFSGCRSLTSITIPNSVTKIKDAAFQNCSNLISVVLPNNITSIIGFTFENCTSLTSITIPYGVTYIGTAAFSGCANLKSIILPNSTITIYQNAFRNCTALTSMVIPQSVTRIDEYAIYECPNLKDIWYTGTQSQKVSIQISSHNDSAKSATWHYESCIIGGAHTYDDECDAICNFCDFTRNEPHKFTNACDTSCDCGYVRNVTHSYEWVIDKQANCGETGTKHEECTVCHTQYNGNTIISATGNHEYDNNCDSVV